MRGAAVPQAFAAEFGETRQIVEFGKRHAQPGFGQTVDRRHGVGLETPARDAVGLDGICAHLSRGAVIMHTQIEAADQAHVMIERQPADAAVINFVFAAIDQGVLHHGEIGEHVVVRHRHGLRQGVA